MQITDENREAFLKWLGEAGVDFFTELWTEHGHIPLVIKTDVPGYAHPIHFREGMQIRNWMRSNTDIPEEEMDDRWIEFTVEALQLKSDTNKTCADE